MRLTDAVPFYVTRKTADDRTMSFSVSAWLPIFTSIIAWYAALLWSIIALVAAVVLIVSTVVGIIA